MSLLNDALRGAEQRRERPAPDVYTGASAAATGPSTGRRFAPLLILLVLTLVALVAWLWWSQNQPAAVPQTNTNEGVVSRAPAPPVTNEPEERQAEQTKAAPATPSEPETVIASTRAEPVEPVETTEVAAPEAAADPTPEPEVASVAETSPVAVAQNQDLPATPAESGPTPTADGGTDTVAAPEPSKAELAAVKQQRETPEVIDRRTDAELKRLLAKGRLADAEELLASVVAEQSAPMSRARLARHLIIANEPARALAWLPETATRAHPELRLLRARAQLALGNTDQALAGLEQSVPAVSQHPEYLVTLAALLQQEGRANDAVGRWAELVAYNDSQAAWWVGLAIALEADQQTGGAQRAYQQALALSDLSPTLADFCRQRLQALGAG